METFHSTWPDRGRVPQSSALPFTSLWGVETRLRNPATPSCGLSPTEGTPSKMMYSFLLRCRERKHSHEIILFALVGTEITLLLRNAPLCCLSSTAMSQSQCPTLLFFSNRNLEPETAFSAVFWQQKFDTINNPLYCLLATETLHCLLATEISQENTPLCGLPATEISLLTAVFQQQKFHTRNPPLCCLSATEISHQKSSALLSFSNRNFTPETLCSFVFQQQKFHTRNAPFCFLSSKEILPETLKCLSGPEVSPRTLQACLSGTDKTLIGHKPYTQLYYLEDRIYTSGGTNKQSYTLLNRKCTPKKGLDWLLPLVTVAVLCSIMSPNKCSFLYGIFRNIHLLGLEPLH